MTPRGERVRRRRRAPPRVRRWSDDELELINALEIIELLASYPGGLTVPEIIARLRRPAEQVVRNIAFLQHRRWLQLDARCIRIMREHLADSS